MFVAESETFAMQLATDAVYSNTAEQLLTCACSVFETEQSGPPQEGFRRLSQFPTAALAVGA